MLILSWLYVAIFGVLLFLEVGETIQMRLAGSWRGLSVALEIVGFVGMLLYLEGGVGAEQMRMAWKAVSLAILLNFGLSMARLPGVLRRLPGHLPRRLPRRYRLWWTLGMAVAHLPFLWMNLSLGFGPLTACLR